MKYAHDLTTGVGYVPTDVNGDGVLTMEPNTGGFTLTNGEATTANGTAVDLGGTYNSPVTITSGGGAASLYIDNIGQTGIHLGDVNASNGGAELGIASNILYWDDPVGGVHNNLFGINISSPTEALHVIGNILMDDGTQQAGYVLTSDAAGVGTWQAPTGGSASLTATYIGYGSGANTLTGDANLTWNATNKIFALKNSTDDWVVFGVSNGIFATGDLSDSASGWKTGINTTTQSWYAGDTSSLGNGMMFYADDVTQTAGFGDPLDTQNNTSALIDDAAQTISLGGKYGATPGNGLLLDFSTGQSILGDSSNVADGSKVGVDALNGIVELRADAEMQFKTPAVIATTASVGDILTLVDATTGETEFAPGGSGTVTSVGLSLPSIFSVSGSPVTTSGTLTGALATQTANTVFAGPTTGSAAAPTFRSLVAADIPALGYWKLTGNSGLTDGVDNYLATIGFTPLRLGSFQGGIILMTNTYTSGYLGVNGLTSYGANSFGGATSGSNSVAFGRSAGLNAGGSNNSTFIGDDTSGSYNNVIVLGYGAFATAANQFAIGSQDHLNFPLNAHSAGAVLTSNGSGIGTWQNIALPSLANTNIWIGNASNVATANAISGDAVLSNTGVLTLVGSVRVLSARISLSSAQVLALNGTPIQIVATPGAGKYIDVISASVRLNYGTTDYVTNTSLRLRFDTASAQYIGSNTVVLGNNANAFGSFTLSQGVNNIIENKKVELFVDGGNPASGDSTVDIYITYKISNT